MLNRHLLPRPVPTPAEPTDGASPANTQPPEGQQPDHNTQSSNTADTATQQPPSGGPQPQQEPRANNPATDTTTGTSKSDSQAAADHEERLRRNPYLQHNTRPEEARPPAQQQQQHSGGNHPNQQPQHPAGGITPEGAQAHFQHLDEHANRESHIKRRGPPQLPHKARTEMLWVAAGKGKWVARVEALPGGANPTKPKEEPQRGLNPTGQELWTAPPFGDGTILEVETTMGYAYLITILSVPAPHRQEGGTLIAEPGQAFMLEQIQDIWMLRPAGGPRHGPPKRGYRPPPPGEGRAVGNSTNPGIPFRGGQQPASGSTDPQRGAAPKQQPPPSSGNKPGSTDTATTQRQQQQQHTSSASSSSKAAGKAIPKATPPTPQATPPNNDFRDSRTLRGQTKEEPPTREEQPQQPQQPHKHFFEIIRDNRGLGDDKKKKGEDPDDNTELWQRPPPTTTTTSTTTTTPTDCRIDSSELAGNTTDEEAVGLTRRRRRDSRHIGKPRSRSRSPPPTSRPPPPQHEQPSSSTSTLSHASTIAALRGGIQATAAQIQLIHEVTTNMQGAESTVIANICANALRMLSESSATAGVLRKNTEQAFPSAVGEAYRCATSMRVRRGDSLTPEEYATDVSILRSMVEQGIQDLPQGEASSASHAVLRARARLQKAYEMLDAVILRTMGGDRQWNDLKWWDALLDHLAPATLIAEQEGERQEAHPADVIALDKRDKEWTTRTSTTMSATMQLLEAAAELREAAAFMGDGDLAPVLAVLHAIEAWQNSLFGGMQAVSDETQTEPVPETDMGEQNAPHAAGTKRRWFALSPGVNQEDMAALETDSFLADLAEVELLPTLPELGEAGESQQATLPWTPPAPEPLGAAADLLAPSEGEEESEPSPEGHRLALAALHDAAEPDLVSFNSAAAACARATQWPQALRLLGNLAANALRADQRTWTPLLPVLPWPRALQVLRHLEARSLHLDPPLLSAAVAATARARAWAATLQLLNELRARDKGGRSFAVGLSAAIQSLAKASRWRASVGLMQEAHETRRLQDDVVLLSTCLLACRAGALWQLGLGLLQDGAELPITAAAPYNSAISVCAEASQWQTALQLLADAERLGILDITTCNASITACDRGHAWQHAIQVLRVAKEHRVHTDAFSSAAAVSSCASAAQWRMALGLFVKELPGPFALSALLAACGAMRQWEHGLAIWQGWPAGRDLDLTCQNAALYLLAPLGRWMAALQVLDAMCALGTTDALSVEACRKSCEVAGAWPPMPHLWQAAAKEAMLSRSRANDFAEAVGESTNRRLRLERLRSCLGKSGPGRALRNHADVE
ncbi:MRL1 [Symbiodinium sp. CCMP2592]|nr:MRL1 [Symbiodinium sp. CCMP2592]